MKPRHCAGFFMSAECREFVSSPRTNIHSPVKSVEWICCNIQEGL